MSLLNLLQVDLLPLDLELVKKTTAETMRQLAREEAFEFDRRCIAVQGKRTWRRLFRKLTNAEAAAEIEASLGWQTFKATIELERWAIYGVLVKISKAGSTDLIGLTAFEYGVLFPEGA